MPFYLDCHTSASARSRVQVEHTAHRRGALLHGQQAPMRNARVFGQARWFKAYAVIDDAEPEDLRRWLKRDVYF